MSLCYNIVSRKRRRPTMVPPAFEDSELLDGPALMQHYAWKNLHLTWPTCQRFFLVKAPVGSMAV